MAVCQDGDFRQRWHAYYLVENNSRYYPDFWQSVGSDFFNQWEAWEYLAKKFPGKKHGVQGVEWSAYVYAWGERDG